MNRFKPLAILSAVIGTALVLSGLAMMVLGQDNPANSATSIPEPTIVITEEATAVVTEEPIPANTIPLPPTVSGTVENEEGEVVAGAVVQIQTRPKQIETDENGTFSFDGIEGTTPIVITAWAEGHYIGWVTVNPSAPDWAGGDNLHITLRELPAGDNNEYTWFEEESVRGSASCGLCHREYTEWQLDTHSQTASNIRFLTMYTGNNVNGDVGQTTQWNADGEVIPIDPNQPYFGPGFKLDNYGRAGNCAACHTPLASTAPTNTNCAWSGCHTDLTIERSNGVIARAGSPLSMSAAEGISCEFCHKISDVFIDRETGLPYPDMPGIMSVRLNRPRTDDQQVFFGTLVDVTRNDSYLPLLSESQFCASCHHGVFGGVVGMQRVADGTTIYNSYGEWLDSPYSNPENETTCQDCHMPVSDANWFVYPERLGHTRDYVDLHNHTMPGASEDMLQNAVTLDATAERTGDTIQVEVNITNDKTGHNVPTDAPMRSMILVVEVRDAEGNLLEMSEGSVNPDFSGDYGGVPGRTFALVLRDEWTGISPTAAFWREVSVVEDSRLAPMATDTTSYTFAATDSENVTVHVRLLFRRAFYELAQQKGWSDPDILMEEAIIELPTQ
jgi:hypothetical protein